MLNPYADKQRLIQEVRKGMDTIAQMGVHFVNEKGVFMDTRQYTIPSDHYISIGAGIEDRIMEHREQWIEEEEKTVFGKWVKDLDFEGGTVILNRNEAGTSMGRHYHMEAERLVVCKGTVILSTGSEDNEQTFTLHEGEEVFIDRMIPHTVDFLEKSYILVHLIPPVPKLIK